MNIILFDDATRFRFLPFTHTRPVADIRCGIFTMRRRWELQLQATGSSTLTESYLQEVFPFESKEDNLYVNGAAFANEAMATAALQLDKESRLVANGVTLAARTAKVAGFDTAAATFDSLATVSFEGKAELLQHIWDIFAKNEAAIQADFPLAIKGKTPQALPDYVTVLGRENVFVEEGATILPCIINATKGPVYIAKDTEVMEGSMLRGPIAIGEHVIIKMGAKIYGGTTIGDGCRAGGEVNNVVMFANSNKGHDGYLGNSVLGEWCNLGADTNSSNLKNNYDLVKIWDEHNFKSQATGLQFCGLLMGDHSKCSINTMFNTGTVVGVSANIFGSGFPEKFVPSFSWGGSDSSTSYELKRALETAERVMARRSIRLNDADKRVFQYIFDKTQKQRDLFCR